MKLTKTELKEFLEEKYDKYNSIDFIESDPICIPHQFTKKEDIEISGFLAATIAWGQRVTIINNANRLLQLMDNDPYDFILNAKPKDLKRFSDFKHRTFNGIDAVFFMRSLQNIYKNHGGLQKAFNLTPARMNEFIRSGGPGPSPEGEGCILKGISNFRNIFFSIDHPSRTGKHISNPSENSSSKRLCMYLRWMVRNDKRGVDFGIWSSPPSFSEEPVLSLSKEGKGDVLLSSHLMCPLDIHSGNVGRKLGLLNRTQNDWKAVIELTNNLKKLDAADPVKYDFALFGLGVFEKF